MGDPPILLTGELFSPREVSFPLGTGNGSFPYWDPEGKDPKESVCTPGEGEGEHLILRPGGEILKGSVFLS